MGTSLGDSLEKRIAGVNILVFLCSATRLAFYSFLCESPTFDRKSLAVNLFTLIIIIYPTDVQRPQLTPETGFNLETWNQNNDISVLHAPRRMVEQQLGATEDQTQCQWSGKGVMKGPR